MPIDSIVADAIDRAITIEMRFAAGLPRGVTEPLYRAARERHGVPLTWLAATSLKERVSHGRNVFVVTGAGAPPGLPKGETDGPIGAAAIAHALEIGLGGKPILLSEARNMPAVIASTEAAGIAVVGEDIFEIMEGLAANAFNAASELIGAIVKRGHDADQGRPFG